ncbi:tetratricopeptide repeat protein [Haliscomenobacter sp.]|uniref:tetratricopeptide repeat protein n=1 Tax=Haliscomenobacter sp. TaxID=2717303 RepID=UPI003BA9D6FA
MIDWYHIKQEILELFTLKHRLYHLYSASLSRLNNLEFEHIWSVYISGKFEDTIEYCKTKIKEEENILWHAIISHAYYITYQYKIGLFHVQKALSMIHLESNESIKKELYPDLKMKHASILAELGRTSGNEFYLFEAFNIWIALIETEQRIDSSLFYNFANTCLLLNKLDLAEVYFLRALNFDKNNPQAWTNLADVYGLIGNFKKELDCYKKAIQIDQSLKNALIGEGIALYHLKEYKKSLKILLELKEYEKDWRINYSDYYYYLSEVYDKLCQPDKSIEVAEEGLFYDPGNIKIINKLCELYSSRWESSEIIKGKAKKLYLMRLQVCTDDLRTIGELVNIKISDGFSVKEIAEFVKSHISIEHEMTDEDIVTALTKKRSN